MMFDWEYCKYSRPRAYRRIMWLNRRLIIGTVWKVRNENKYRWMASSPYNFRTGVSKTLKGAKQNCTRAMKQIGA